MTASPSALKLGYTHTGLHNAILHDHKCTHPDHMHKTSGQLLHPFKSY